MGKTLLEFQPNKGDVLPAHKVRLLLSPSVLVACCRGIRVRNSDCYANELCVTCRCKSCDDFRFSQSYITHNHDLLVDSVI